MKLPFLAARRFSRTLSQPSPQQPSPQQPSPQQPSPQQPSPRQPSSQQPFQQARQRRSHRSLQRPLQPSRHSRDGVQLSWSRFLLLRSTVLGLKLLCMGGIGWAGGIAMMSPQVYAYTTQDLLSVSRETGEDYNALTRRAEAAARSLAQQRFDSDILLTRVIITVLGDNGGQVAPILVLDVNRTNWRSRPDPQIWATYYRSTPRLLEMNGSPTPTGQPGSNQPAPAPTPATPSPRESTEPQPIPPARFPVPVTPIRPPISPNRPESTVPPTNSTGDAEETERNPVNLQDLTLPEGVAVPRSILR